jgi:mediator of RNA polymerase II transcription subunit 31
LKNLQLLQHEQFRKDILNPDLMNAMVEEGKKAAVQWHKDG